MANAPESPSPLGKMDLHLLILADVSGSMASDGKIQSLNVAMEETIPSLQRGAAGTRGLNIMLRVIAFATTARWVVEPPTPISGFRWVELSAQEGGLTETGRAIELATEAIRALDRPAAHADQAHAVGVLLVSDGMPTDTVAPSFDQALDAMDAMEDASVTGRALRFAIGIGRDVDDTSLRRFTGGEEPLRAENPHQLMHRIGMAMDRFMLASVGKRGATR